MLQFSAAWIYFGERSQFTRWFRSYFV